ncbi:MAG: hypothetical protein KBA40_01030 [Candidatus Peribacteraceae bacterium]|nr:hypothetical protein [Candidatus Peribacteraceae bacterium]MBP9850255.1 hypothetical protein [Candidatus Peribacteraceae bacterium]
MATLDTRTETAEMTLQDLKRAVYGTQKADAVQDATFLKYLNENPDVREDLLSNKDLLEKHDGRKRVLRKNVQALLGEAQEEIHIAAAKERYKKNVDKKTWTKWAYEKLKSVVLFPVRHPLLMILAATLGYMAATGAFTGAAGLEAGGVSNAIQKSVDFLKAELSLSGGKAGIASEALKTIVPGEL